MVSPRCSRRETSDSPRRRSYTPVERYSTDESSTTSDSTRDESLHQLSVEIEMMKTRLLHDAHLTKIAEMKVEEANTQLQAAYEELAHKNELLAQSNKSAQKTRQEASEASQEVLTKEMELSMRDNEVAKLKAELQLASGTSDICKGIDRAASIIQDLKALLVKPPTSVEIRDLNQQLALLVKELAGERLEQLSSDKRAMHALQDQTFQLEKQLITMRTLKAEAEHRNEDLKKRLEMKEAELSEVESMRKRSEEYAAAETRRQADVLKNLEFVLKQMEQKHMESVENFQKDITLQQQQLVEKEEEKRMVKRELNLLKAEMSKLSEEFSILRHTNTQLQQNQKTQKQKSAHDEIARIHEKNEEQHAIKKYISDKQQEFVFALQVENPHFCPPSPEKSPKSRLVSSPVRSHKDSQPLPDRSHKEPSQDTTNKKDPIRSHKEKDTDRSKSPYKNSHKIEPDLSRKEGTAGTANGHQSHLDLPQNPGQTSKSRSPSPSIYNVSVYHGTNLRNEVEKLKCSPQKKAATADVAPFEVQEKLLELLSDTNKQRLTHPQQELIRMKIAQIGKYENELRRAQQHRGDSRQKHNDKGTALTDRLLALQDTKANIEAKRSKMDEEPWKSQMRKKNREIEKIRRDIEMNNMEREAEDRIQAEAERKCQNQLDEVLLCNDDDDIQGFIRQITGDLCKTNPTSTKHNHNTPSHVHAAERSLPSHGFGTEPASPPRPSTPRRRPAATSPPSLSGSPAGPARTHKEPHKTTYKLCPPPESMVGGVGGTVQTTHKHNTTKTERYQHSKQSSTSVSSSPQQNSCIYYNTTDIIREVDSDELVSSTTPGTLSSTTPSTQVSSTTQTPSAQTPVGGHSPSNSNARRASATSTTPTATGAQMASVGGGSPPPPHPKHCGDCTNHLHLSIHQHTVNPQPGTLPSAGTRDNVHAFVSPTGAACTATTGVTPCSELATHTHLPLPPVQQQQQPPQTEHLGHPHSGQVPRYYQYHQQQPHQHHRVAPDDNSPMAGGATATPSSQQPISGHVVSNLPPPPSPSPPPTHFLPIEGIGGDQSPLGTGRPHSIAESPPPPSTPTPNFSNVAMAAATTVDGPPCAFHKRTALPANSQAPASSSQHQVIGYAPPRTRISTSPKRHVAATVPTTPGGVPRSHSHGGGRQVAPKKHSISNSDLALITTQPPLTTTLSPLAQVAYVGAHISPPKIRPSASSTTLLQSTTSPNGSTTTVVPHLPPTTKTSPYRSPRPPTQDSPRTLSPQRAAVSPDVALRQYIDRRAQTQPTTQILSGSPPKRRSPTFESSQAGFVKLGAGSSLTSPTATRPKLTHSLSDTRIDSGSRVITTNLPPAPPSALHAYRKSEIDMRADLWELDTVSLTSADQLVYEGVLQPKLVQDVLHSRAHMHRDLDSSPPTVPPPSFGKQSYQDALENVMAAVCAAMHAYDKDALR